MRLLKYDPKQLYIFYTILNWTFSSIFAVWNFIHRAGHPACRDLGPSKRIDAQPELCGYENERVNKTESTEIESLMECCHFRKLPMKYWMMTASYWPQPPSSLSPNEFLKELLLNSFFMTLFYDLCRLFLSQPHEEKLNALPLIRRMVLESLQLILKSEFLRNSITNHREMYFSVIIAPDYELVTFLNYLAKEFLTRPIYWYPYFVQYRMRLINAGPIIFKGTNSLTGILFKVISNNCCNKGIILNCESVRKSYAPLFMLSIYGSERDVLTERTIKYSPVKADYTEGYEEVILSMIRGSFERCYSFNNEREYTIFNRERILTDIEINLTAQAYASEWKDAMIDRACWVCTAGRMFMTERTLDLLKAKNGKPHLDLTIFSGLELLAFSISGLIIFEGRRESLFKLTGCQNAPIHVRGYLPKVKLSDFLALGLAREVSAQRFIFNKFPGLDVSFKIVRISSDLLLVTADTAQYFSAKPTQVIS